MKKACYKSLHLRLVKLTQKRANPSITSMHSAELVHKGSQLQARYGEVVVGVAVYQSILRLNTKKCTGFLRLAHRMRHSSSTHQSGSNTLVKVHLGNKVSQEQVVYPSLHIWQGCILQACHMLQNNNFNIILPSQSCLALAIVFSTLLYVPTIALFACTIYPYTCFPQLHIAFIPRIHSVAHLRVY